MKTSPIGTAARPDATPPATTSIGATDSTNRAHGAKDMRTGDADDVFVQRLETMTRDLNGCASATVVQLPAAETRNLSQAGLKRADALMHKRGYFRFGELSDAVIPYFPHCQVTPQVADSPCNPGWLTSVRPESAATQSGGFLGALYAWWNTGRD